MSNSATITREQMRIVVIFTELGGKAIDANHFSYAKLGKSTYSFGQLQFDVEHSDRVKGFLKENGFDTADIEDLSKHGGLSRERLDELDAKLQAVPQAKMDQFTNDHLDRTIAKVGNIIDDVRQINSAAADAIIRDKKLQLGIADYINQFGYGSQFVGFLAEKEQTLPGGKVQAGNPPTREDIQAFIGAGRFGQDPVNARGVAGRETHFNMSMAKLGLGPAVEVASRAAAKAGDVLHHGDHGAVVQDLQTKLAVLGYTDSQGRAPRADADFGSATRDAVERFQSAHGLTPDGKVGPATWQAIRADVQMLRHDDPELLPAVTTMSSMPASSISPDDPRHALNPNHALFNDLKHRFPDASDNRLLQFTAACHANGITDKNLRDVRFDQQNGVVSFGGREEGQPFRGASVDVKEPSPPAMQSIQQIQQFDQHQAQIQATVQAQIAQTNAQAQQGPVMGGR